MITLPGYLIKEKIYESGSTAVYRGCRSDDNLPVVIKYLNKEYPAPDELSRFKYEYEITKNLDIDGIIKVYGLEKSNNSLTIIYEDFGGEALKRMLPSPRFDLNVVLSLAIRTTDIIGRLHLKNIIHKDINPSNIVWNPQTDQVKIIDLGFCSQMLEERPVVNNTDVIEGTLAYMSPEQTGRMNHDIDYRSDLYALGVTLYEIFTGYLPFQTTDPVELVHCHMAVSPMPPHERNANIPRPVSDILMRLLSKTAEDRYQSAYGLKADLKNCLNQHKMSGQIKPFPIGKKDITTHLLIPTKLYGRKIEITALMDALDRVSQGRTELMMVSGYSGIGKSALIHETYKPVAQKHGYFITGKFDQFIHNTPYAQFIFAFRELVRRLLAEPDQEISIWKKKLLDALGPNGQVIIEVIPEVEMIIDTQPLVPDLPPAESENRFNLVFQRFIQVFAQSNHPLVIFLDDLQWADSASLKMIQTIMTDSDIQYLFLIGAYRENLINASHPLMITTNEIRKTGVIVNNIALKPLELQHVNQLIAETLGCDSEASLPLSELCFEKTDGNPFFLYQFLYSLYDEKLIVFNANLGCWQWHMETIRKKEMTDNVVELMVEKIQKLSGSAQKILRTAACIGNIFDLKTLSIVNETSQKNIAEDLFETIREGLVASSSGNAYKFIHDRVHQAAYSLILESQRQIMHLTIGRLFLKYTEKKALDENIFDIVNQLNLGIDLISDPQEKTKLAQLNLMAGEKAKISAAYEPAFNYLKTGLACLEKSCWETQYDLTLKLSVEAAEAAYLSGDFKTMGKLSSEVLNKAKTTLEKIKIFEVMINAAIAANNRLEAVRISIRTLKKLGVHLSEKPSTLKVLNELIKTKLAIGLKGMEKLPYLPENSNSTTMLIMRILGRSGSPAFYTMPELLPLIVLKEVRLSIKYGNAPISAFAYAGYGLIHCGVLFDIDTGYRFGELAIDLANKPFSKEFKARTYFTVNVFIKHWKEHGRKTLKSLLYAYGVALETGDLEFAAQSACTYCAYFLYVGGDLKIIDKEMVLYTRVIRRLKQKSILNSAKMIHQTVLNLMGGSETPWRITGDNFNEDEVLPIHLAANDGNSLIDLYLQKFILSYLFHQKDEWNHNRQMTEKYLEFARGIMTSAIFNFYDSLTRLADIAENNESENTHPDAKPVLKKVTANQKRMKKWMSHAPMNYGHKWHLVEAEKAKFTGNFHKAMSHYRQAITGAKENEYIQEEALANELYANFWLEEGENATAVQYIKEAGYLYKQWGATAKVKHLENRYKHLFQDTSDLMPAEFARIRKTRHSGSSGKMSETIDLSTILKASHTLSGEIVLGKLLVKMMKISIENAGAQKGFMILEDDNRLLVEAEARVDDEAVSVHGAIPVESHQGLCSAIVKYVARTREALILNNASEKGDFTKSPYVEKNRPKSILCLPILNQGRTTAILYLENNLTAGAFTLERTEILDILSSQIAISIENAKLYENLEEKIEERTAQLKTAQRELVDKAHRAGMADMATGTLHNVGNILNSLTTSTHCINDVVRNSSLAGLQKANNLLRENIENLENFITDDPKGKKLMEYYLKLEENFVQENDQMMQHIKRQREKIQGIANVIGTQLKYTKAEPLIEPVVPTNIIEDVLAVQAPSIEALHIKLDKTFDAESRLNTQKAKLAQTLSAITENAIEAMETVNDREKVLSISVEQEEKAVSITIGDSGNGIHKDNLEKIFFQGFSTKKGKHGLGLHYCAGYMSEINGEIKAESKGEDRGARFVLKFPLE